MKKSKRKTAFVMPVQSNGVDIWKWNNKRIIQAQAISIYHAEMVIIYNVFIYPSRRLSLKIVTPSRVQGVWIQHFPISRPVAYQG